MRRTLVTIGLLASAVLILALAGCGSDFPLPTEVRGQYVADKQYHMDLTWTNMAGIQDILFIQGAGAQLFLLFTEGGEQGRGRVEGYALRATPPTPHPLNYKFGQLFVPAALCAGTDRVYVLDQGDSCEARKNEFTGDCTVAIGAPGDTSYHITDLSKYWHVKEYGLVGGSPPDGAPKSSFTDTSFAFVRGIAADDQNRIYISGTAIVLVPNVGFGGYTRTFQYRVYRYRHRQPGEAEDLYMPSSPDWVRDRTFEITEGSGVGTLLDPRGIYWAGGSTPGGAGLFAADFGKNWVQKLSDAASSQGYYAVEDAQDTTLAGPLDVSVDRKGFLYVADTGNSRVLRYDPYGAFVQKINIELDADGHSLVTPVSVAADDSLVYVADRAAGRVVRYRRRD
jgi:hypothetical protein